MVLDPSRQELIIIGNQMDPENPFSGICYLLVYTTVNYTQLKYVTYNIDLWSSTGIYYYDPSNYAISWFGFGPGGGGIGLLSVDLQTTSLKTLLFNSDIMYSNQIYCLIPYGNVLYGLDGINQVVYVFDLEKMTYHSEGSVIFPTAGQILFVDCTARTDKPGQVICILGNTLLSPLALEVIDLPTLQVKELTLNGPFGSYPFYIPTSSN